MGHRRHIAPVIQANPAQSIARCGAWLDYHPGFLAVSTIVSDLLMLFTGDGNGGISMRARNLGFGRGKSADSARVWAAGDVHMFNLVNIGPRTVDGAHDAAYVVHSAW